MTLMAKVRITRSAQQLIDRPQTIQHLESKIPLKTVVGTTNAPKLHLGTMGTTRLVALSYLERIKYLPAAFFVFVSIAAITSQPANAQQPAQAPLQGVETAPRDDHNQIVVHATHTPEPLVIDGLLEDEIYRRTKPIDRFIQQVPNEGEPATDKTEVWIFFETE